MSARHAWGRAAVAAMAWSLLSIPGETSHDSPVPGLLDGSFSMNGTVTTPIGTYSSARDVAVDDQGRIVAVGVAHIGASNRFAVVRYLSDGQLDPGFGAGGIVTTPIGTMADEATGVVLQPDGQRTRSWRSVRQD